MLRLNTRLWTHSAGSLALAGLLSLGVAGCGKKDAAPAAQGAEAKAAGDKGAKTADKKGAEGKAKADAPAGKVPADAKVFFKTLKDGAVVEGMAKDGLVPVHVEMGVTGMRVEPAGAIVEGSGHHHIIVDASATKVGMPVKKDAQHIHFGKGQTAADLHLKPGAHTLTLQFANGAHLSYGPQLAASVKITVKAMPAAATGDKPASADVPAAAPAAKVAPPPAKPAEPDPAAKAAK